MIRPVLPFRASLQIASTQPGAHGLDLIVVDYLQLMSGSTQRYENRTQEISQISRGLKG